MDTILGSGNTSGASGSANSCTTELAVSALVVLAASDSVLVSNGLLDGVLDSDDPSIGLGAAGSEELVLLAVNLEREAVSGLAGDLSCIGKVDDALRVRLVLGTLGEEQQALASLACVCDVVVSDVLLLLLAQVLGQRVVGNGLTAEPEVLLAAEEAPGSCQRVSVARSSDLHDVADRCLGPWVACRGERMILT